MRLPLFWLTDYVDPGLEASALAARLAMTGTEVDRVHTHGVTALDYFVVGRVLEREQHPDADRLSVCRVSTGEGDVAQIVCGAPNVAAGQTVAVALPGAVMPDGTKLKRSKLRGVVSEGMILAEDELAHRHRSRRDHGPQRRPPGGHAAGRRAADRHRRARARDHAQPAGLPVGLRRRARGPRRDRRAAEAAAVARRSRHARRRRGREDRGRGAGPVPALHRAAVRGRQDRPVAAVAEGAPDRPPASARSTTSSTSPTT